jgi:hypothetical protein
LSVFKGHTSTNATSDVIKTPQEIQSFVVSNTSGGTITLNIYVISGSSYSISPYNLTLEDGDTVYEDAPIKLGSEFTIYITTTGTVSYYFTISDKPQA